jgi:Kef-type K+ transport system membrane component KefB
MKIKDPPMISLAEHPRASVSIRRAKAAAGLIAFVATAVGASMSGMSADAAAARALVAGIAIYLVSWAIAVSVWRAIVRAETKIAVERLVQRKIEQQTRIRELIAAHPPGER